MNPDPGRALITGASGFIGGRLAQCLRQRNQPYRMLCRRHPLDSPLPDAVIADLSESKKLRDACVGINRVFHCAGHAHAFRARSSAETALHWQVNFEGTRNLVEAAGQAGVRRFVFLSSVKATGEPGEALVDEEFHAKPLTAYGQSKRAAEEAVLEAGKKFAMQVVILRLAMVYGSGGRGNLERMGRLVAMGLFPPLPETGNHRSLIHVDDVVDAMCTVAGDDRASGRTYIITGPEAPSGRELYDAMRQVLGKPRQHWSIPAWALRAGAGCGDVLEALCGKRVPFNSQVVDRLLGSAWYTSTRIEQELGWTPKISLNKGLQEMFGK